MVSGYHELLLMIIQHAGDPTLPKNRCKCYKCRSARKIEFQKTLSICSRCNQFMNTLMRNGYPKKLTGSITEGKRWYIPHHRVYNKNKPNKIRVIFDCSTEYQRTSLNNELMSVHWNVVQTQARTDYNNGEHRVDVLPGACTRKTSKFPKILLVGT